MRTFKIYYIHFSVSLKYMVNMTQCYLAIYILVILFLRAFVSLMKEEITGLWLFNCLKSHKHEIYSPCFSFLFFFYLFFFFFGFCHVFIQFFLISMSQGLYSISKYYDFQVSIACII